ncbi:PAAR domain-containing protein [Psychrobacter sp. DM8]|uniref:PAAR domain-containing protein n=1 Tax=Psychrobacter sp. DM8 TaxID=3440636 RepID=UPI003F50BEFA
MAAYITVGATTTHGGKVITGSPYTTHNGVQVSRKGDKVICRKCKKVTTILTGDPTFIVDGAPIARSGDVTSCGAKLIAIQQSFCESDFEVAGVEQPEFEQPAPLVFPKSDPAEVFASFAANNEESPQTEMSDEALGVWVDVTTQQALDEGGLWAGAGTREEIIYQERLNSLWIDVNGDRDKYYEGVRKIGDEAGLVLDIMSFPLGAGAVAAKTGVKAGQYVIRSKAKSINKAKIKNNNQIDDDLGNKPLGGAHRANQYSHNWQKASLKDARKKFAGDNPKVTHTESGKIIHENRKTGVQVVYDREGDYFTVIDNSIKGKRKYLDLNGNVPNNKTLSNGKKAGRSKSEYREATHFKVER